MPYSVADAAALSEEMPSELGSRLRRTRLAKRLRLADVAVVVGCSESLLSKIETSKAMPSLRMLHRIALALGTSIAELYSDPAVDEVIVRRAGERPTIRIGGGAQAGGISLEQIAPFAAGRSLDANVHVVAPGADNGGSIRHDGEEIGYVVEGEIELTVNGHVFCLTAGDSFFFRSDLPHSYRNVGSNVARIVWVNTPPTF
ncbi:cupin domain-containing protein [Benzoatithermus flavus]|uniref:Cupin domain-containing protein n=1 Tax=Benzoatithermus flavus TaxID=3108223 RepID=A0ABU8XQT8_9PROT